MGTILEFRQGDASRSRGAERTAREAEIVIFPGVRIERWDGDTPPTIEASTSDGRSDRSGKRRSPGKRK